MSQNKHQQWIRLDIRYSTLGDTSRLRNLFVAGAIDSGTKNHFGPKRTSAMDRLTKGTLVMPQPIWVPDQYLRTLVHIRGMGTCVFHEKKRHLDSYVMQQQGFRWNLIFILTHGLYGYVMKVRAKG